MDGLRNFGFILADLTRRFTRRFEQRAGAHSLTLPQCRVLVYLSRCEGITQARLGELTNLQPMMMVRILDRMESGGLLQRRRDPRDRRTWRLYLTPKARPLLEIIHGLGKEIREEALAGLGATQRRALMQSIEHAHGNLCALEEQPVAPASARRRAAK